MADDYQSKRYSTEVNVFPHRPLVMGPMLEGSRERSINSLSALDTALQATCGDRERERVKYPEVESERDDERKISRWSRVPRE